MILRGRPRAVFLFDGRSVRYRAERTLWAPRRRTTVIELQTLRLQSGRLSWRATALFFRATSLFRCEVPE
jgi:hypothetical protein